MIDKNVALFRLASPIAGLAEVTLFERTWDDHILRGHPEMAGKIAAVRQTIVYPTVVVVSPSSPRHYIFVNHDHTLGRGVPLALVVRLPDGVVCTAFFDRRYRGLAVTGSVVWKR